MAWPMPTSGQWSSGIGMTPDMTKMTPEQWAAMQHQNWQQWTQWQQQYAQWQGQYGEKVSTVYHCVFISYLHSFFL